MPYASVIEGDSISINNVDNEALSGDVASIDVDELSSGISAHPVEEPLTVTSIVESDTRQTGNISITDGDVGTIGYYMQPSAIRNDEDNFCNDGILEVRNARLVSVSDRDDQGRNISRTISAIREYLFQQEVATIDAIIITPQQRPSIMIHLRKNLYYYSSITLLCAIGITIFFSHRIMQISRRTAGNVRNHDRASMTPSLSNSSLPPSIYPSLAPSIRRNTKYHYFFDTFKKFTPEDILSKPSSPQHRALLWLANDDNRTMFIFDPKLLERYALVTLFFATGGGEGSWDGNYNFLSDVDVCDWMAKTVRSHESDSHSIMTGASCVASEGRSVSELDLESNNLVGTIPEELRLLTSLTKIDLLHNNIRGTIPSLLSFKHLNLIFLGFNLLKGTIPEFHNNLKLGTILIIGNDLSGTIPESLRKLSNIKRLQLDHNKLSGSLPNWIGELKMLEHLSMSNNNFHQSTIPLSINNLSNLIYLDLANTQLTGYIPITNNAFPKLEYLILHNNLLSGTFPNAITTSASIKVILLNRNRLKGQLSTEISMMSSCKFFSIYGNNFSGSISPLLALTELINLSIASNNFSGNIPLEIGNLKKLRSLTLDNNNFTGAIPTTFSKLSHLVSVDLSNNQIFGDLTEICLKASDLETFSSDCLSPDTIICPCCTFCC